MSDSRLAEIRDKGLEAAHARGCCTLGEAWVIVRLLRRSRSRAREQLPVKYFGCLACAILVVVGPAACSDRSQVPPELGRQGSIVASIETGGPPREGPSPNGNSASSPLSNEAGGESARDAGALTSSLRDAAPISQAAALDASGGLGDPPYANVVAVTTSGQPNALIFSVTLESSDVDCSHYADWWELLSPEGELLYRRVLTHSHTDENGTTDPGEPGNTFTRNGEPVSLGVDARVVVRAHTNLGGYNGQSMSGTASQGFEPTELGEAFAPGVESLPPQPTGCSF